MAKPNAEIEQMPGPAPASVYDDFPHGQGRGSQVASSMGISPTLATPWGRAGQLAERGLGSVGEASRDAVERNQRERLFGAIVAVTTTKGYAATTVADLVKLAGVSRSTFYRDFADKQACFLAALEEILATVRGVTASRLRDQGSWEERAARALGAFLELVVAQPAGARLCLVEAHAAGSEAVDRVDAALADFGALMAEALKQGPGAGEMPAEMTRALAGGVRKIVHTHLRRGSEAELLELAPGLLELGRSYRPPPRPLRANGRRAPEVEGLPRGDGADAGERIVRATMATVAAQGYADTAIADLAAAAGVSLRTFYEHFDGKAEAFEASLDSYLFGLQATAMPAYRRARSWPLAIRGAVRCALAFFAAEAAFAQVATAQVYAAGPHALERRDRAIEAAQRSLTCGFEDMPAIPPLAGETALSAVYSMLCDRVRSGGAQSLPGMAPLATYTLLAPFVGAEEACSVARGDGGGER